MHVNTLKLRGKIVEKGFSVQSFIDPLSLARSTFYRKLQSGGADFTLGEVFEISNALQLTRDETQDIFLVSDSQN